MFIVPKLNQNNLYVVRLDERLGGMRLHASPTDTKGKALSALWACKDGYNGIFTLMGLFKST